MSRRTATSDEIGLTEGAALALMSYNQLLRLVCLGKVLGRKRNGRWLVSRQDALQLRAQRATNPVAGEVEVDVMVDRDDTVGIITADQQ
jgi:hypothetical protein